MAFKYCSSLVLLAFAILSCKNAEARGLKPIRPPVDEDSPNSLFGHPKIRLSIIEFILQSRDTSLEKIQSIIDNADGNLELIVSGINSELNSEILRIDGDSIRINGDNLKTLIREAIREAVRRRFPNNPSAAAAVEGGIDKQFADQSERLDELIESHSITVDSAKDFLANYQTNRNKRSLQPRQFDLTQIISDIVFNILRSQFSTVARDLLENVKTFLLQIRVNTAPANDFERVISYGINTLVQGAVQFITTIQESIVPSPNTTETARRKRQADDVVADDGTGGSDGTGGDGTDGNDGAIAPIDNTINNSGGLLEAILQPVLTLVKVLLSPVSVLLQTVFSLLINLLSPILGGSLTSSLANILNSIIGALLPF